MKRPEESGRERPRTQAPGGIPPQAGLEDEPARGRAGREAADELSAWLERLRAEAQSVFEHARELARLRAEKARHSATELAARIVLASIAGIAGLVALAFAVPFAMLGLAEALSRLFETGPWLGRLVVGGGTLLLFFAVVLLWRRGERKRALARLRSAGERANGSA